MLEITRMTTTYRETPIEYNLYGQNEYSIQYCGDDYFFETEKDARKFIDDEICSIPFC